MTFWESQPPQQSATPVFTPRTLMMAAWLHIHSSSLIRARQDLLKCTCIKRYIKIGSDITWKQCFCIRQRPLHTDNHAASTVHDTWKWTEPCECHSRQISQEMLHTEHLACHSIINRGSIIPMPLESRTINRDSRFLSSFTCRVLYGHIQTHRTWRVDQRHACDKYRSSVAFLWHLYQSVSEMRFRLECINPIRTVSHKIRAQLIMGGQGTGAQGVPGLILGEPPLLMSVSNEIG